MVQAFVPLDHHCLSFSTAQLPFCDSKERKNMLQVALHCHESYHVSFDSYLYGDQLDKNGLCFCQVDPHA